MSKKIAYIGTKMIHAVPAEKIVLSGSDKAVVVEHDSPDFEYTRELPIISREDGYKVIHPDGYESWSPKDVFEEAYRPTNAMNFGLAIEAAKKGKKIAREGWNGKGMWVVYRTGYPDGIPCNKNTADAVGIPEGSLFKVCPYLQMKCVDGSFQMWLASQSDILADDWFIVD